MNKFFSFFFFLFISVSLFSQPEIIKHVEVGQVLPASSWVIDLNQDTVHYREFSDKWLLIDFWTQGCIPCIQEFPYLNKFAVKTDTTKIRIIGIFVGKNGFKWSQLAKRYGLVFPTYYGGWSQNNALLALNFKIVTDENSNQKIVTHTPQYVLIAPGGLIVDKELGKPSTSGFLMSVNRYLGEHK